VKSDSATDRDGLRGLVLTNGRVYRPERTGFRLEASDLLVRGERLFGLAPRGNGFGNTADGCLIIDLHGRIVLPGLADAHLHLSAGGQSLAIPNLTGLGSNEIRAVIEKSFRAIESAGRRWIEAFNWESRYGLLNADLLEDACPGIPATVHQKDLHTCCVNRTALAMAGIDNASNVPTGGRIETDVNGRPTGILRESAIDLVTRFRPQLTPNDRERFIQGGIDHLVSRGLTGVCEVLDPGNAEVYDYLDRESRLAVDIDAWRRFENWDGASPPPPPGRQFKVQTLKVFLDGSFGSRTAALFEPYADDPTSVGMLMFGDTELLDLCRAGASFGWRMALHAIGDQAVDQAARILAETPVSSSAPHRIEHLQMLPRNGTERIARSKTTASIQPVHLLDDQVWLAERIGVERCRRSFIWRSLQSAGVPIAIGSDWPVSTPDPLKALHVAINQAGYYAEPTRLFDPAEALFPGQAIAAMTTGFAASTGWESLRGRIDPGFQADFTIVEGVSSDLADWSEARVVMTIARGNVVYETQE